MMIMFQEILLFKLLHHAVCTTQKLYKNYKDICLAQASEPVSEISVKRCVNSVYKISPVKTRSNNSDLIVYKGIKYV